MQGRKAGDGFAANAALGAIEPLHDFGEAFMDVELHVNQPLPSERVRRFSLRRGARLTLPLTFVVKRQWQLI